MYPDRPRTQRPDRSSHRVGRWRRLGFGLLAAGALTGAALAAPQSVLAGFVNDLGEPVPSTTPTAPLTLLVFGYTSCPDICPLTLQGLHQALDRLGPDADQVAAYFVSVDPERDTTEQLHNYVMAFDPRIRALRGPDEALRALTARLHVQYWREALYPDSSEYAMNHTATLFLLDSRQRVLARIPHRALPDAQAHAIVQAIRRVPVPRRG